MQFLHFAIVCESSKYAVLLERMLFEIESVFFQLEAKVCFKITHLPLNFQHKYLLLTPCFLIGQGSVMCLPTFRFISPTKQMRRSAAFWQACSTTTPSSECQPIVWFACACSHCSSQEACPCILQSVVTISELFLIALAKNGSRNAVHDLIKARPSPTGPVDVSSD